MDTIYIYSVPYNVSITLPKDQLVEKFPMSLLAKIIEQDSEVDKVDIENKSVTPEVLNWLHQIVTTGKINYQEQFIRPVVVNGRTEYHNITPNMTEAGRYLLMPIFEVISDRKYHFLPGRYNNIPLDDVQLRKNFNYYFSYAIGSDFDSLVRYMIERAPFLLSQKQLELPLAMTIYVNKPKYYQWLRPYLEDPENVVITLTELKSIYPMAPIKETSFTLPELAILSNANDILQIMLDDPAFSSYDWKGSAFRLAYEIGNIQEVRLL